MTLTDRLFDRTDKFLDVVERGLIGALALAGLALGTMQVLLRYVFNTGFHWNEAVFILCTVTAMLIAGAKAVRENAHVRVDVIHMIVPAKASKWLDVIAYATSFLLCAFYAYCGVLFVSFAKMMDTASPETGFKDWMVVSIMPVAMAIFSVRYVLKIRAVALGREVHEAHADKPQYDAGADK
mgnify:FL=1